MLEKYISAILVPYLSKYAENVDSKQLNIDLWSGKASLSDLILKSSALDSLLQSDSGTSSGAECGGSGNNRLLPLTLQRGICRKVNISIPFTQLRSKPVVVEIDELFICVRGNTETHGVVLSKAAKLDTQAANKERELELFEAERQRQRKMAAAARESGGGGGGQGESTFAASPTGGDGSKSKGGYFSRLGELIVNNIVVKVRSVHVRYEDESTKTVIGAILGGVRLLTVDSNTGEARFIDPSGLQRTNKRMEFSGLQFYCDDPLRYETYPDDYFISQVHDFSWWCAAMRERVELGDVDLSTVLGPVSGHIDSILVFKEFVQNLLNEPYLAVRMKLECVIAKFNRAQYVSLMRTVSLLSNWTGLNEVLTLRPRVSVRQDARVWWRYAINAVRAIAGAPRRERLMQRISEVCMMDYHVLYRDVVRKAEMSTEKLRSYRFITRFMTVPDMITGRKYVYTQIANEIQLKRKDIDAKKAEAQSNAAQKNTGWFGWMRRGPSTPQELKEEELAFEELEKSYGVDPSNSEEVSTEISGASKLPKSYCWLDAHFELGAITVRADLSTRERATLMLHRLGAQLRRYNAPDSLEVRLVTENLTLSNPINDDELLERLPNLVEGFATSSGGNGNVPLLECKAAINPVEQPIPDTHLDFVMDLSLLPLRIVADPSTLDGIVRFFEFPKGVDLGAIVDRTKGLAASVGSAASAELRLAMARSKSLKISVDVVAPHIILPRTLRGGPDEPALAVSLGHVKFDTQPLTETEKERRLAMTNVDGANEELLYYSSTATFAHFYVGLVPIDRALEKRDAGFMLIPEVAFSAEVLQRIDVMADNRERLIVRMDVPALRMACSVNQAYILSSMVESWITYLGSRSSESVPASPHFTSAREGMLLQTGTNPLPLGASIIAGDSTLEPTYALSRSRRGDSESEEKTPTSLSTAAKAPREDLPCVRLHMKVRELGIAIYEDDKKTQQTLTDPRFKLAFRTADLTLHARTVQKKLEMILDAPYCQDARDPDQLILSGTAVRCRVVTAPEEPVNVDVKVEPSLRFRLGTPFIQLLESIMDIVNLIATAPDVVTLTERGDDNPLQQQQQQQQQPQQQQQQPDDQRKQELSREGGRSEAQHLQQQPFLPLSPQPPSFSQSMGRPAWMSDQIKQLKLVKELRAMADVQIAHLNLRIGGTTTVELMDRRPGESEEDYLFAYASFSEMNLSLKKNRVTMELHGGVEQVAMALSEAHKLAPMNRVILEYRAPILSPESSMPKSPAVQPGNETLDEHNQQVMLPPVNEPQQSSSKPHATEEYHEKERRRSHQHVSFAYRTSRPVMPIFNADNHGKRQLMNAAELRFSSFVEVEIGSSAVLLDMHSILTVAEYFSTGFFKNVTDVANRPRYDGRVVVSSSSRLPPPPLLTSVRVFARDLAFILPIDARTGGENFQVSVDHVALQSSLLSTEGQQAMNIALREIRMQHGSTGSHHSSRRGSAQLGDNVPSNLGDAVQHALLPTTTLDVSVKSPLDTLSDDPLRVDLKGDDLSLSITEDTLVQLCQLASGNLTRFPPPQPMPAPLAPTNPPTAVDAATTATTEGEGKRGSTVHVTFVPGDDASNTGEGSPERGNVQEVCVTWRSGSVAVSFLADTTDTIRFQLVGTGFTLQIISPSNHLSVRWDSLELIDAHESAQKRASMLLCGASRVDMRNILTTRGIMMRSFGARPTALSSDAVAETDLTGSELSGAEPMHHGSKTELLEVTTLVVDFTLRRFAVSDQWLAVYDFVCNEAVMRALQPIMGSTTTTMTPPTDSRPVPLMESDQVKSAAVATTGANKNVEGVASKGSFRCLVTTRTVSIPFLTTTREEFLNADVTSLLVDVILLANTTNVVVRMQDLTVRDSASGECIFFKKNENSEVPLDDEFFSSPELQNLAPSTNAPNLNTVPTLPPVPANAVSGAVATGGKCADITEGDILTVTCTLDSESERQKVTLALGQLSALCSAPLLMQIVEYCTSPNQPMAKISNLGVMRERREWLARAAVNMVDSRAFSVHLLWQQPSIILAGDALELSNKSRNIEARLGVMRTTVHLDKRNNSCVVSAKLNDFAIPDMLEKSVLRFAYAIKEKREALSITLDKTTALLHPAEVEKLLWILQRNLGMPASPLSSQATPTEEKPQPPPPSSQEQQQQQEQKQQEEEGVHVKEPAPPTEAAVPRTIQVHVEGLVVALHDVVGINLHTASLSSLDVEVVPDGDMTLTVRSLTVVEHYTNRQMLRSAPEGEGRKSVTILHSIANKTTDIHLTDVNFMLLPRALGSLLNVLLSVQFPPPLTSPTGTLTQPTTGSKQRTKRVSTDTNVVSTRRRSSVASTDILSSLRLSMASCSTVVVLGDREICVVDVFDTKMERRDLVDASSTLKATVAWITVRDVTSPNTSHPEIARPFCEKGENSCVVDFSFVIFPLHEGLETAPPVSSSSGVSTVAAAAAAASQSPVYTQCMRCHVSSMALVVVPEVTSAVAQVLGDVKEHISDINREKAYDYVADKTAQTIQERQSMTQLEVILDRPSILLVDTAASTRVVEVFPGDLVIRNELSGSDAEMFCLSLDRVSLNILGSSAFHHDSAITVTITRALASSSSGNFCGNEVSDTSASASGGVGVSGGGEHAVMEGNNNDHNTTSTGDGGATTVTLAVPRLVADLTQDQLSCLLDVFGALQHNRGLSTTAEVLHQPGSSASQVISGANLEGASVGSCATPNATSLPLALPSTLRRRPLPVPLLSQHLSSTASGYGEGMLQNAGPSAQQQGSTSAALTTASPAMQLSITASMQQLDVNIDSIFRVGIHSFDLAYSTAPTGTATTMTVGLESIILQHRVTGGGNEGSGTNIFVMRRGVIVTKSSITNSTSGRLTETNTDVKLDVLAVSLSPLMLVDTRELLYGPFCMKVLRLPLQPIPVCRLSAEVLLLDSDLVLDSSHVVITASKSRCIYRLDLNQHRLFLSGAPSAQIVLDDGCQLTITNGTVVIPGAYSLSSFVSFGLNAALFTTPSCIIEKQLHFDRGPSFFQRGRLSRARSRTGIDSSVASQSRYTVPSPTGNPPASQQLVSTPPPPPRSFTPPVTEERARAIASFQCPEVRMRMMSEEVEELGVTLLMSASVLCSQEMEAGNVTQRGGNIRLQKLRTAEKDETTLLPTTFELSVAGADSISIAGSLNAFELCVRVALMRYVIELSKDFFAAFIEEATVQRHPPRVDLEDEQLRPLQIVQVAGECRSCNNSRALVGEHADAPGVLCYRCCTGRETMPATAVRFEIANVNLILVGHNGSMLRLSSPEAFLLSVTPAGEFNVQTKLFMYNLNNGAALWEPLIERFEGTAGGKLTEFSYWVKIVRLDYIVSPTNLQVLSDIFQDFSVTSSFQKQIRKKIRQSARAMFKDTKKVEISLSHRHADASSNTSLISKTKEISNDVPYAFVCVENFFNETLEVEGMEVGPRGGRLEFTTNNRILTAHRSGVQPTTNDDLKIDVSKSPVWLRTLGLLVGVHVELSRTEDSRHLHRTVQLRCYPVHDTEAIICFENNLSCFVEVKRGLPPVKPAERFYFQARFPLDERLLLRPVHTVDAEEYEAGVAAFTNTVPTLRELLNRSFTKLICKGAKNPNRRFVIKVIERQEGVRAGTPTFILAIQPQLALENNLPYSICITIVMAKGETRSQQQQQQQQQVVYTGVIESRKVMDISLGAARITDVLFHMEILQSHDDNVSYRTKVGVDLGNRLTPVTLCAGTGNTAPELRLNVHHLGNRLIFSTPFSIVNFTPLPLRIRECNSSGELISSSKTTNFEILPKNMQYAYAASPRKSGTEFFVTVSSGDNARAAVPLHAQERGLIILEDRNSISTKSSSSRTPASAGNSNNESVIHLVYLTEVNVFGTLFVTIVPRWIVVNRTPRSLHVAPAISKSVPTATTKPSSTSSTTNAASGLRTSEAQQQLQYRELQSQQHTPLYYTTHVQMVPAGTSTPLLVTPKCSVETGYHAFVLQTSDAPARGDPVSLEDITNAQIIAHAARNVTSVPTSETDLMIETSVVVDGAYTFLTLQDPVVPPTILLNRTNKCLTFFDRHGQLLARALPGSSIPFVMDTRDTASRTRVCLGKDLSLLSTSPAGMTATTAVMPTTTLTATANMNATTTTTSIATAGCGFSSSTNLASGVGTFNEGSSSMCVEFNFLQPMTPQEASNALGIEHRESFGPFGQRIIEIVQTGGDKVTRTYKCPPPASSVVVFNMSIFSVSIVRANNDMLFAAFFDTRIHYNRQGVKEVIEFSIKNFQVDNQSEIKPVFDVCVLTVRPSDDSPCVSGYVERTVVPAKALLLINEVRFDVVPTVLRISDTVLIAIMTFVRQLSKERVLRQIAPTDAELFEMAPLQVGATNTRVIMERLVVNPLILRIWFEREDEDFIREELHIPTAALLSMMVRSCEDVRVETPGIAMKDRTASAGLLLQWVMQVYLDNLRHQVRGLLFQYASSLPLIGAPIKFVSGVGTGAMKFFREPIVGLSESPKAFAAGLASGSSSLAADVFGGGLGAVSNLAKTGAGLMSVGVSDRERRKTNILRGFASGVKGVVTKPMEGAAESGAAGLMKGVGLGLLGVVTNPVAGILSDVSKVTGTAAQLCDDSYLPKVKRMRHLRDFHACGAVAAYQSLISVFQYDRGEYRDSRWHSDTLLPSDGAAWYPCSREQAERERGLPHGSWSLDRFDTNYEGWTFANKYYGRYTREQTDAVRVRRRRWVAQLKRSSEDRIALLVQLQGCLSPAPTTTKTTTASTTTGGGGGGGGERGGAISVAGGSVQSPFTANPKDGAAPMSGAALPSSALPGKTSPSANLSAQQTESPNPNMDERTVLLYEYESKVSLIGWSSRFLPAGFAAWQDGKGAPAPRKADVRLLEGWVWSSNWATVGGDADGWEFVRRESKDGSVTLRRRAWQRGMKRVG